MQQGLILTAYILFHEQVMTREHSLQFPRVQNSVQQDPQMGVSACKLLQTGLWSRYNFPLSVVQISMWKHPHTEKCEDYIKWLYLSAIVHHHKHTYTGKKAHQGNILFVIWSKLHTMSLSITLSIPTIRFLIHKWSGLSSLSWYTKLHTTTMSPLNIFSLKNNLAGWFFLFPLFSKPKSCKFPFLRFEAWIVRERE